MVEGVGVATEMAVLAALVVVEVAVGVIAVEAVAEDIEVGVAVGGVALEILSSIGLS